MIRIYKDFIREGAITSWLELRWLRSYNDLGKFELVVVYDNELFSLITENTELSTTQAGTQEALLYKEDVKEAMFIQDINVFTDKDKIIKMRITGVSTAVLLDRRVATLVGTLTPTGAVINLLNNNFITPTNVDRKMNELVLGNISTVIQTSTLLDYSTETSVLVMLSEILKPLNIGFKVDFDFVNNKYVFNLYEGVYSPYIVYDRNFNNIIEEDWYFLSRDYANAVSVGGVFIGSRTGISRRERAISIVKDENIIVTGQRYLAQRTIVRSVEAEIDTYSDQFIYLTDWNLGDIITFRSEMLKTITRKNVTEIQEIYENGNKKVEPVFGDYLRRF